MQEPFDQYTFEANARKTVQELSALADEYDQISDTTITSPYSSLDPKTRNLVEAVAAKLRAEKNLGRDESLEQADRIVRQAQQEVNTPTAKQRICASFKSGSQDSLVLLPILLELAKSGVIAIPFDPTGTLLIAASVLIVLRMGLESFCAEGTRNR